jgi:hypothetical protein
VGVALARHDAIRLPPRFSALLVKKNSSFGFFWAEERAKQLVSLPPAERKKAVRDAISGCLFFRVIEMTAEKKERDVLTLWKRRSTLKALCQLFRKVRDQIRIGIDKQIALFFPPIMNSQYHLDFNPVWKKNAHSPMKDVFVLSVITESGKPNTVYVDRNQVCGGFSLCRKLDQYSIGQFDDCWTGCSHNRLINVSV